MTDQAGNLRSNNPVWLIFLSLALLVLGGMFILWYITPFGMGLVNDSIAYIGGARNILAGNGYSRLTGDGTPAPITNYPPMVSMVLAVMGSTGLEVIPAARLLNIFLFGSNILLMYFLGRKVTENRGYGLLAGLLFGICSPLLGAHSYVMSEPLHLFLTMIVLLIILHFLESGEEWRLLLAGFFSGIAFLTRYVGFSLFVLALLVIWFNGQKPGQRIKRTVVFLLAGLPSVLVWLIRNMRVAESAVNRRLIWHPIPAQNLREGLLNFWSWLLPEWGGLIERFLPILGLLLVFLFVIMAIYVVVGGIRVIKGKLISSSPRCVAAWVVSAMGLTYLAVLVLSLTLMDASPIFEHRILSPLYICLLLLAVMVISRISTKGWAGRLFAALVAIFILFSFLEDSMDTVRELHREGQGFASSAWRESQTLEGLDQLNNVLLYSNKPTAIYILLDRPSYYLPSPINPATQQPRENYKEDLEAIKTQVLDGRAVMVIFDYRELLMIPEEKPWMEDLAEGLPVAQEFEDGVILGLKPAGS